MKRSVFRRALPLFLCLCMLAPLTSCGAAEGLLGRLGFDTHNYRAEKVVTSHAPDSETARELLPMLEMLCVNTPYLTPFAGPKEAAEACRDAILTHMLSESYARYAGNSALLAEAAEVYPHMQLNILIPADDFEAVIYAAFGGNEKINNRGGAMLFRYLPKIDAYTTAAGLQADIAETEILSCEETERTFRVAFRNTVGEVSSPAYFAILIKRDDGTVYISALEMLN